MRALSTFIAGLLLSASTAFASPAVPQNGIDYITLAQPQPVTSTGKQVEVIEFFMYHCPVCNALEPQFNAWIKEEGARIVVRRIHVPLTGASDPEAHLYLTLDALGQFDAMHDKVFHAVHVEHIRLNEDAAIIDWAASNGIDRAQFLEAWNSFDVTTRLHQLGKVMRNYQVDGAPTLVIDGKYQTSPGLLATHNQVPDREALFKLTLQAVDSLVTKAARTK